MHLERVTASMFIAGIRKLNRTRGDGWLDCPNCGEHAVQDVVDEMKFAALGFYRFSPVGRRRVLICRRCNFHRTAGAAEMGHLRTVGRGVSRALMLPVGLSPLLIVLAVVLALAARSAVTDTGLSFVDIKLDPIAPATASIPAGYNHSAIPSSDPLVAPLYSIGDPTGIVVVRLRHYLVNDTAENILKLHYNDDAGLNANGFPDKPPEGTKQSIGGVDGLKAHIEYTLLGGPAAINYYVFNKDGNAYILSIQELNTAGITAGKQVESHLVDSFKFTGSSTPAPSPSPSPAASGSTSTSSSATTSSTT